MTIEDFTYRTGVSEWKAIYHWDEIIADYQSMNETIDEFCARWLVDHKMPIPINACRFLSKNTNWEFYVPLPVLLEYLNCKSDCIKYRATCDEKDEINEVTVWRDRV